MNDMAKTVQTSAPVRTANVDKDGRSLCECGCGLPAPILKRNRPSRGQVAGGPARFIKGHRFRVRGPLHPAWTGGRLTRRARAAADEAACDSRPPPEGMSREGPTWP